MLLYDLTQATNFLCRSVILHPHEVMLRRSDSVPFPSQRGVEREWLTTTTKSICSLWIICYRDQFMLFFRRSRRCWCRESVSLYKWRAVPVWVQHQNAWHWLHKSHFLLQEEKNFPTGRKTSSPREKRRRVCWWTEYSVEKKMENLSPPKKRRQKMFSKTLINNKKFYYKLYEAWKVSLWK